MFREEVRAWSQKVLKAGKLKLTEKFATNAKRAAV